MALGFGLWGCGDDTGSGGTSGGTGATGATGGTTTTGGAGGTGGSPAAGGNGGAPGGGAGGAGGDGGNAAGGGGAGGGGGEGGGDDANVVINEVVPDPVDPSVDWVELYNAGSSPADISGWTFTDNDPTHVFTFPAQTMLQAGAYLTVDTGSAAGQFDFGLSGGGDEVNLYDAGATLVDSTTWAEPDADEPNSWGRFPNGTGLFSTRATVTKGGPNL